MQEVKFLLSSKIKDDHTNKHTRTHTKKGNRNTKKDSHNKVKWHKDHQKQMPFHNISVANIMPRV